MKIGYGGSKPPPYHGNPQNSFFVSGNPYLLPLHFSLFTFTFYFPLPPPYDIAKATHLW